MVRDDIRIPETTSVEIPVFSIDELVINKRSFIGNVVRGKGKLIEYQITPSAGFFSSVAGMILTFEGEKNELKVIAPINRSRGEHEVIIPYLKASMGHDIETDLDVEEHYHISRIYFPTRSFEVSKRFNL